MPNGKVTQPVTTQRPVMQKTAMPNHASLKILGFGLASGIVGAICMIALTIATNFGQFSAVGSLFNSIYGFLWYSSSSWLGVLLGAIYGFIDWFVIGILIAWFYNIFSK